MNNELYYLWVSTISVAALHTLAGPDHYLPFIALSKTKKWSLARTLGWTALCGCAHVASSVGIGLLGTAAGWGLSTITNTQNIRGGIAGWLFVVLGLVYAIWGLWRARRNVTHKHFEMSDSKDMYVYEHRHGSAVVPSQKHKVTPWVIFIIFLLGPCEPLIPLLTFPGLQQSWHNMLLIILTFTICTLVVMLGIVTLGYYGLAFIKMGKAEKYMHALAGLSFFLCGAGMVVLGW
jgi:sulfite exporter TauE/SafE